MPSLTIDNQVSPRIVTVDAPDTQITVQEIVDLLREWEDSPAQADDPQIISAAGKEDLGGGVFVGISATLLDAQLAFEARTTELETGAATAIGTTTLTDATATFQTNNIGRGDLILNLADGSQATVVEVLSETQLTHTALSGGAENDWDIGESYEVYDVVQCSISGGNLVATDTNNTTIDPVFPTFGTQVVRTSSSSATLQELQDIQFSSYAGGIWYDAANGVSGTEYPIGTERQPVNNFTDGLAIASARGFNTFFIRGDATIGSALDFSDYVFVGQGQNLSNFTINADANVLNCTFIQASVTGTLDGDSHIEECIIDGLNFVSGVLERCILNPGTIVLGGSETAHLIDCQSGVPGVSTPVIDCGGSGQALAARNYNGGLALRNKTGTDSVSLDLNSGQIVLENTVTNGTVVCRGVGKVIDQNGDRVPTGTWNGANIINETLDSRDLQLARKLLSNRAVVLADKTQTTIYDDDGVTVLWQFTHTLTGDRERNVV